MSFRTSPRHRLTSGGAALVAAAAASVLIVSGCSPDGADASSTNTPNAGNANVNESARQQLPAQIRDSGELVVAVTPTYPPFEYLDKDGKTVIGLNADVLAQAAQRLGLKVKYEKVAQFGSVLTGIQANRFAAGVIFSDTKEREEVVDIVSYYQDGVAVVGESDGSPANEDACGTTVGIATGSLADVLKDQLNKDLCAGKKPMTYAASANSDLQFTALNSGRVKYVLTSFGVGESLSKQSNGKYQPLADPVNPVPTGIALNKGQDGLAEALTAVIGDMKKDGSLAKIFDQWTTSKAIIDVGVNAAGSK